MDIESTAAMLRFWMSVKRYDWAVASDRLRSASLVPQGGLVLAWKVDGRTMQKKSVGASAD